MSRFLFKCQKVAGLAAITLVTGWSAMLMSVSVQAEPAPVFEAVTESGASADALRDIGQRLSHLERQMDNQALVEMITNMDRLHQEIQQLMGQLEEQTHSLDGLRKRQRDLYVDIDQRLQALETARDTAMVAPSPESVRASPATNPALNSTSASSGFSQPQAGLSPQAQPTPSPGVASGSSSAPQADTQLERKNYELAFNLLKQGQYDSAVAAFQAFLGTYPAGRFADNAQYWLGETNYVQRRFNDALQEFGKVLTNHPDSPKRADAMLKMGYTYQELGDDEKARVLLNDVIRDFPASTAASLAKKRLQDFKLLQ